MTAGIIITGVSIKKPTTNETYDFLNEASGLVVHYIFQKSSTCEHQ